MCHIIDALQAVAPVATWTVVPHRDASDAELACPPFVAWRYETPSDELAEFLRNAISTFGGEVAWELLTTGPRWILAPARLREYAEEHGCGAGLIAAAKLKVAEPGFGKRANAELGRLAEHIERHLKGRAAIPPEC
jgi:hypothetical protein